MQSKPADSQDGVDVDYTQIEADLYHFHHIDNSLTVQQRLHHQIIHKQALLKTGLVPNNLAGFEKYEKYSQLMDMAANGLQPFSKSTFTPNRGVGDFRRETQHRRLRHTIAQHIKKLQVQGRCVILPKLELDGVEGVHVSALHVASKAADSKGRPCVDATHSGLNDGTDIDALTSHLGEFKLPQLRALARMLEKARKCGHKLLHKTDVSSAFNTMLLSPAAALLQIFQFGDLLVIPLVAGFGWNAAPAYYNVIAGAIHWAHNGGISPTQLDTWTITQGRTPHPRPRDHTGRSITYVDDSCGHSSTVSVDSDMGDIQTVISQLLGPAAYNKKKTEGPLPVMTIIGWKCDLRVYTIQPGSKGQCKMYYWVFRGLDPAVHMPLTALQSAVGTLRWYSAVVPMASTWELQRVLTTAQRRQSQ